MRVVLILAALLLLAPAANARPGSTSAAPSLYINHGYDPLANSETDLARAVQVATSQNKRILLVIGGDWCVWCTILDTYLSSDVDVHASFAASFVMIKVNWDPDHQNTQFLSRFPETHAYPDFIILDSNGHYLAHQGTDELEEGRGYNHDRMIAFARAWRRPQQ